MGSLSSVFVDLILFFVIASCISIFWVSSILQFEAFFENSSLIIQFQMGFLYSVLVDLIAIFFLLLYCSLLGNSFFQFELFFTSLEPDHKFFMEEGAANGFSTLCFFLN